MNGCLVLSVEIEEEWLREAAESGINAEVYELDLLAFEADEECCMPDESAKTAARRHRRAARQDV
jgi:hypothetical protein